MQNIKVNCRLSHTLRTVVCWAVLSCCCIAAGARTYVVVAAVDVMQTLNGYAVRNAQRAARFFRQQGAEDIRTFYHTDATRANIITAMDRVARMAGPDDAVYFVYSGHGYAETTLHNGGVTTADKQGYLGYNEIQILLKNTRAGKKIAFINACYAGGLTRPKKSKTQIRGKRGESDDRTNVMLYLSSKGNESSYMTRDGFDFMSCIVDGMAGKADTNGDKKVTARELFNYVNPIIVGKFRIHPQMWGRFDDDMVVANVRTDKKKKPTTIYRPWFK